MRLAEVGWWQLAWMRNEVMLCWVKYQGGCVIKVRAATCRVVLPGEDQCTDRRESGQPGAERNVTGRSESTAEPSMVFKNVPC